MNPLNPWHGFGNLILPAYRPAALRLTAVALVAAIVTVALALSARGM